MRRSPTLITVLTGLALLSTACGPGTSDNLAAATTPARPGSTPPLVQAHDPGQVTYSRKLTAGKCHARTANGQELPDPACTPGAIDPNITEANLSSTLCRPGGYTGSVRPPVSGTDGTGKAKHYTYAAYSIPNGDLSELDHLVPLAAGGANDITNLWPELGRQPNPKDHVEVVVHDAICAHKVDLATAQRALATNWTTALSMLHLTGYAGGVSTDGD